MGGGLIGLSCAWELQQRGWDVVVYERDLSRRGSASWAGAGMLGALGETFTDAVWRGRAMESARLYPDWVAGLGGVTSFVASGEDRDGHVDPRELVERLSGLVRLVEREVSRLDELEGEQIVVTAGAWASQLDGVPEVGPVKGYLIAWDGFAAGTLRSIVRDGHVYILQRPGGRIVAGSTEQRIGFDGEMDERVISELLGEARRVLPVLETRAPSEVWFGFRPAAEGDVPVVRRLSERVVAAYGHYRNGILLAPWTARWVADEVARGASANLESGLGSVRGLPRSDG